MSADPTIPDPGNLQSFNRYSYVLNNPLHYTDPSGYSFWTSIRSIVVRVVAAVADAYGCSGYCSAAVGAYQGSQQGGTAGAIIGAIGGYTGYQMGVNYPLTDGSGTINWGNVATVASVNAATGCASAAAAGGNCGRGALSGAIGTVGNSYGFMGSVIAGCAAGKISGGSCGDGALDAVGSFAVYSAIRYAIDSQRMEVEARRPVQIACAEDACVFEGFILATAARSVATTGAALTVGAYWDKFTSWVVDVYDSVTYAKPPQDAYDANGPKAPGKPGPDVGFEDPKGGENWVRNPNGRGYGWEDNGGRVWVPTGPNEGNRGDAHGGPHWDVQDPRTGRHRNIRPLQ